MKYKLATIIMINILIISSLSTIAIKTNNNQKMYLTINNNISFSETLIEEDEEYINILLNEKSSYLMETGKPILPIIKKTYSFPFGTKIKNVEYQIMDSREIKINGKIRPAPKPIPKIKLRNTEEYNTEEITIENTTIYSSSELYPHKKYDYNIYSGLQNRKHVTFLTINFYPIQYNPLEGEIIQTTNADLTISYEKPLTIKSESEEYNMVIITPDTFVKYLQKLVDHKNSHNVKTYIKTTEAIYQMAKDEKIEGRDKAEQIKYYIKDAIEKHNISYVLLIGGMKGQRSKWYIPARYSHLEDFLSSSFFVWEPTIISDLYYADIYDGEGNFSSWDTDRDKVYGEWDFFKEEPDDILDLCPDVYVGRLPCRYYWEVQNMVDKIIEYENNAYNQTWFKKMITCGGDTSPDHVWSFIFNTKKVSNGAYTIYAQCSNDTTSSEIQSIKINILNFKIFDKSTGTLDQETKTNDNLPSNDLICTIDKPEKNDTTFGKILVKGKAYNVNNYGTNVTVDIWIQNKKGETVFNTSYILTNWFEGEIENEIALNHLPEDFEKITLWTSDNTLTSEKTVINTLNEGCGLFYLAGHGNPLNWGTYKPYKTDQDSFVFGLTNMRLLKNNNKLPVCVVGGCHNSQFDVSLFNLLKNPLKSYIMGTFIPECWSWRLTLQKNGGTIATIGNTGLGYELYADEDRNNIPDCIEYLSGKLEVTFFEQYGNGTDILGQLHSDSITNQILTSPFFDDTSDIGARLEYKTVQQWALFGDPSLKIGGYENLS
jgi:hypothetical protein